MRFLGVFLLVLSLQAHAEICGLYQIEDFGDRVFYSLVDFRTFPEQSLIYSITNNNSIPVKTMVNGMCYCLEGEIKLDPAYEADSMYMLLNIQRIDNGPFSPCGPGSPPK